MASEHDVMWDRVDEIVARAPNQAALRWHGVELLAASRLRRRGLPVPAPLVQAQRVAALAALAAPVLLRRVRAAWAGPLVLMKGPEVAAAYRDPATRGFKDLDLLVSDVEGVQRALQSVGFLELAGDGFERTAYHLRPLVWPGLPLTIEIHCAPHYVPGLRVPAAEELLRFTAPSRTTVPGLRTLSPSAHAVLLAAHGWAHGPLERLGHLIDVAAVLAEGDRDAASLLARRWGCSRLWASTTAAIDALLLGQRSWTPLSIWGRHLRAGRERTLLEWHLAELAAPAWALPLARRFPGVGAEVLKIARREAEEPWRRKLRRSRGALAHAVTPVSDYRTLSEGES